MKSLTHDARGFVRGVVTHLKKGDKRSQVAPKVTTLLMKMSAKARKERQATVESAVKLTADEQAAISRMLEKVAGHTVGLDCAVKPSLIGGFRITMADWVMDASVKQQLAEMAVLLKGGRS